MLGVVDNWGMLLGFVEGAHHQLHDCLMDAQTAHQVRVLEEHLVVSQVPEEIQTSSVSMAGALLSSSNSVTS